MMTQIRALGHWNAGVKRTLRSLWTLFSILTANPHISISFIVFGSSLFPTVACTHLFFHNMPEGDRLVNVEATHCLSASKGSVTREMSHVFKFGQEGDAKCSWKATVLMTMFYLR